MTSINSSRRALLSSGALLAAGSAPVGANNESNTTENNETNTSSAASDEPTEQETMNAVQFAHVAPDVGAVDVFADSTRGFDDVELFDDPEYISYSPKTYSAAVTPTGEDRDAYLLETDVTFESGAYTLVLVGEHCATTSRPLSLVSLQDDYTPIEDGHARVRFIHASPDAPTLDLRTDDGEIVAEGVDFAEGESVEIPGDDTEMVYALHETGVEEPLGRYKIEFAAGSVYTALAVGYQNPEEAPDDAQALPLQVGVFEDSEPTE